jgi:hypothetical protein
MPPEKLDPFSFHRPPKSFTLPQPYGYQARRSGCF